MVLITFNNHRNMARTGRIIGPAMAGLAGPEITPLIYTRETACLKHLARTYNSCLLPKEMIWIEILRYITRDRCALYGGYQTQLTFRGYCQSQVADG